MYYFIYTTIILSLQLLIHDNMQPSSKGSNGLILGYHVGLRRETGAQQEPFIFYSFKVIPFCVLENLDKFTEYSVVVQAFNSKGVSPRSNIVKVRTLEDGN